MRSFPNRLNIGHGARHLEVVDIYCHYQAQFFVHEAILPNGDGLETDFFQLGGTVALLP